MHTTTRRTLLKGPTGATALVATGPATDFCVAWKAMAATGVKRIQSSDLA